METKKDGTKQPMNWWVNEEIRKINKNTFKNENQHLKIYGMQQDQL